MFAAISPLHKKVKRGTLRCLPRPDFGYTDSHKSAFSSACKGLAALYELVVALVVFHLLQDAIEVVGLRRL